jgi:hypothetical protein
VHPLALATITIFSAARRHDASWRRIVLAMRALA